GPWPLEGSRCFRKPWPAPAGRVARWRGYRCRPCSVSVPGFGRLVDAERCISTCRRNFLSRGVESGLGGATRIVTAGGSDMKYLCLVCFEDATLAALPPAERTALNRESLA